MGLAAGAVTATMGREAEADLETVKAVMAAVLVVAEVTGALTERMEQGGMEGVGGMAPMVMGEEEEWEVEDQALEMVQGLGMGGEEAWEEEETGNQEMVEEAVMDGAPEEEEA